MSHIREQPIAISILLLVPEGLAVVQATFIRCLKLLQSPRPPQRGFDGKSLPEDVFLLVLKYLSPSDLTKVVRVSRTFWRVGVPLIWRELEESKGNKHFCSLFHATESESLQRVCERVSAV